MNRFFHLLAMIVLTTFLSCQKQQTEAERSAEIERQVQQRLAAERQTQEQQQLSERVAQLEREKAAADQSASAAPSTATPPTSEPDNTSVSSGSERLRDREGHEATASYSTFYTRLEPHGVWRESSTYGYVWQPREAQESRNWRPYTNGHWVYTDAGWTWVSDESFGWATYHYGRWTRLRNIGWVWVPGDEWAPAWVSWRKSNDYVGWAPLPPEARFERGSGIHNWADSYYDIGPDQYCFVSTNDLGSQRVERVVVPAERNVVIVNETTNVTNITYSNTTIINQGPNYEEIRTRTHDPIPRLRLERQVTVNVNADNRPVVRGETLQISAPVIAVHQKVERPRSVKETITQTTVDHGWESITNRQEVEKIRVKMKSEATPPPSAPSRTFVRPSETSAATSSSTSTTAPNSSVSPAATPAAELAQSPMPTPVRHLTPEKLPPAATATATIAATPMSTATPSLRETPASTMTPHPIRNPRTLETPTPQRSPMSTATPSLRETPASTMTPHPIRNPRTLETPTPQRSPSTTPASAAPSSHELSAEERERRANEQRQAREALKARSSELQRRTESPRPRGNVLMESPSPTATPVTSPSTISSPATGALQRSAENREQRRIERESRREQSGPGNRSEFQSPPASSAQSSAVTPSPSSPGASPLLNDRERMTREERKRQRRENDANETATPSPSPASQ